MINDVEKLKDVFSRLSQNNLKLQPDKCEFLKRELGYLGHIVTADRVKPKPNKVECVKNFPVPKFQKEVKSFLGLAGYYRRFIPNFLKIVKPLTRLLSKEVTFSFNN